MSNLCEFEDTVWDELCQNDDHIVPHPGFERDNDHSILGDSHKKPRHDVTNILSTTIDRSAARYVDQGREQGGFSTLNKRTAMLEKDSSPCLPSGVCPSSSDTDSIKNELNLASDNARSSSPDLKSNNTDLNGSVLCADDTILNDKTMAVDNNSFSYPIGDITHTGNNLDFLENTDDKDSGDFLYYGWSEIRNFEDVDRMFSNCDSTFGLGTSKEDELGWFSSADDIGLSGNMLKSDTEFPSSESEAVENIAENHNSSKSFSVSESAMTSGPIRYQDSSWTSENSDPYVSFVNGPDVAHNRDDFIPTEQINEHRKQFKLQNQSVGKTKEHCFGNDSFSYNCNISNEVVHLSSGDSHQFSPCVRMQQASSPDFCYVQNPTSYVHSDNRHLSVPTSPQVPPIVKSEAKGLTPLSPRDSSQVSSQLTDLAVNGKREKLHKLQGGKSSVNSIKNDSVMTHASIDDRGSLGKQVHFSGDKLGNHSDLDGVSLVPAELVSSDVQESSTKTPGFSDISLEAATFCQLQLVTDQLDLRTKLCIRDSLYRLAQSAEQRHSNANLNGNDRDGSGALVAEGTNNFMDIETDTNPIDRSVAHLLFHRPSESSAIPAKDSMQFKSPSAVQGSITSMPVMVENFDMRK
ncbi:hypothetical protein ACJIZ3_001155 [Penstemon smallii]|uniref:Protein LNK1 n=1 Tax=Penstemon smallii TaxID=265156 RepID=A0ABD3U2Y4_9LAMI